MCGKFTALASWSELVAFSQPLVMSSSDDGQGSGDSPGEGSNDSARRHALGPGVETGREAGSGQNAGEPLGVAAVGDVGFNAGIHRDADGT